MNKAFKFSILPLLVFTGRGEAQISDSFQVQFQLPVQAVPLGSSLPLRFTVTNTSAARLPLKMDISGTPDAVVRVFDPSGKRVQHQIPSYELVPLPTPQEEIYLASPGETIEFAYDVAEITVFDGSKPGRYSIQFFTAKGVVAKTEFQAATFKRLDTKQITGAYEPPQYGELMGRAKASVRLSVIESIGLEKPMQWLLIDDIISIGEVRTRLPSYSIPIKPGANIEQVEMDYLGQVWVSVRSGDTQSLMVWQMHRLAWKVLVPETKEKITMGTTRARMFIGHQNMVFAGVEGKPKKSTLSVWAENDGAGLEDASKSKAEPEKGELKKGKEEEKNRSNANSLMQHSRSH